MPVNAADGAAEGCPMKLTKCDIDSILEDVQNKLKDYKLSDKQIQQFTQTVRDTLEDYRQQFPENTGIQYDFRKVLERIEMVIMIPGRKMNPFEEGKAADERILLSKVSVLLYNPFSNINYRYIKGTNIVTVSALQKQIDLYAFKKPMVLAAVLGLVLGFLCQQLPADLSGFLLDDLVSPLLKIMLGAVAGIMGPITFLSLVTSISTLDSINELNSSGMKLFKRFALTAAFIALVSIVVGTVMFPIVGLGSENFQFDKIAGLLLSVIPTNLITPFVDNNIPQIVVLGVLMGAALLIIRKKVTALPPILEESKQWLSEVLTLVIKLMPAVPFLSVFKIAAKGRFDMLLHGWRYIAATYLCMLLCIVIKLAVVSFRCKTSVFTIIKKIQPLFMGALTTGSEISGIEQGIEISQKDAGIDPDFTSFWLPLSQAMLAPSATIGFVLSCFMVAYISGMTISVDLLLILFLLTVQLSLASPGLTEGMTILFQSVGLSTEYVGLFSAYSVFIKNGAAAFSLCFRMLEQIEAAVVMGKIDLEGLRK